MQLNALWFQERTLRHCIFHVKLSAYWNQTKEGKRQKIPQKTSATAKIAPLPEVTFGERKFGWVCMAFLRLSHSKIKLFDRTLSLALTQIYLKFTVNPSAVTFNRSRSRHLHPLKTMKQIKYLTTVWLLIRNIRFFGTLWIGNRCSISPPLQRRQSTKATQTYFTKGRGSARAARGSFGRGADEAIRFWSSQSAVNQSSQRIFKPVSPPRAWIVRRSWAHWTVSGKLQQRHGI